MSPSELIDYIQACKNYCKDVSHIEKGAEAPFFNQT